METCDGADAAAGASAAAAAAATAAAAAAATAAALGLRVALMHLAPPSQRLLARAACVSHAWRDEAALPAHSRVLSFADDSDADAHVIARLLERHAAHAEELQATTHQLCTVATLLAPDASFPRLARVRECDAGGGSSRPIDAVLALMRAAPLLVHWQCASMNSNTVPVALLHAFVFGSGDSSGSGIVAVVRAKRPLLSPARAALYMDAFIHQGCLPPGASALAPFFSQAASAASSALPRELLSHVGARLERLLRLPSGFVASASMYDTLARSHGAHTLLHHAVSRAELGDAAVLLRAGADPLAGHPARRSALHAAAAELAELLAAAEALRGVQCGKPLACQLLLRPAALRLHMFRLLRRAAVRRHGADAVRAALEARTLPWQAVGDTTALPLPALPSESALSLLSLVPFALSTLATFALHARLSHAAMLLANANSMPSHTRALREADAYATRGDARAAARRATRLFWANMAPSMLLLAAMAGSALWLLWSGARAAWRLAWALLLLTPRILAAMLRAQGRGGAWTL